jgi:outer membrane protein TolC
MNPKHIKICLLILMVFLVQGSNLIASESVTPQKTPLLTSQQLVAAVLLANPQIEIAQATWEVSKARIDQQAAFDDPKFSYAMAPLTIDDNRTEFGQRIEISQKIPWIGTLSLRNKTASHKADATREILHGIQLKLSATTRVFFVDWYFIHQAIKINKLNQTLLKEFRDIAVNQYGVGIANKQDALRAEMELALLEHQAIVLKRKQRSIRTHINTLLNKTLESPLAEPANLVDIKVLPEIKVLQKKALDVRPELKMLAANIKAEKSGYELALKKSYPDINLKAGYNSLWENSSKHFTVGVSLNLPLFQDKYRAVENEKLAQIKQIEWRRVDFIAKLREEIQLNYDLTVESMHVRKLHKHKLLPLAKETLKAAKSDYQSGKGNFLSLISSEKDYMQHLLETEQSLADTHKRLAELESAVGIFESLSETQMIK